MDYKKIIICKKSNYILVLNEDKINVYDKLNFINLIKNFNYNEHEVNCVKPFLLINLKEKALGIKFYNNMLIVITNNKINKISLEVLINDLDNYYRFYLKNNYLNKIDIEYEKSTTLKKNYEILYKDNIVIQFQINKIYIYNIINNDKKKHKFENEIEKLCFNNNYIFLLLKSKNIIKINYNFEILKNYQLEEDIDYVNDIFLMNINNNFLIKLRKKILIYDAFNLIFLKEVDLKNEIIKFYEKDKKLIIIDNNSLINIFDNNFKIIDYYQSNLMSLIEYKKFNIDNTGFYNNCYLLLNIQGILEIKNGNLSIGYGYIY